jgi:hypothetical protein
LSRIRKTDSEYEELRRAYAAWLVIPAGTRVHAGLPKNDTAWARTHELDPKTLARWRASTSFQTLLDEEKSKSAAKAGAERSQAGSVAASEEQAADTRTRDEMVLDQVYALALSGDRGGIEVWARGPGKAFLEALLAAHTSDFSELTDDELAEAEVVLLPDHVIVAECHRRRIAVTPVEDAA